MKITKRYMAIKKSIIKIFVFMILILQFFSTATPVFAQTTEEKNFLLMYFKEEELVVEAPTRSPKPVSQVPENVTVVTASDIELMNAHTIAEVLNTVTGVQVFMTGGPGQVALGYIQGSEQKHVAVFIDGVSLTNLGGDNVELGMIPVQNIEKIEIIKGPASSAWGSALGGVVNIITKSGTMENQGGTLSASYGTKNTGDYRAEARGKQNGLGYYLTAGRLQSDGLTTHMGLRDNNAYAKLTYDLTRKTTILFAFGYEKNDRDTGTIELFDQAFHNTWESMHSSFAINSAISKDLEVNVSIRTIRQTYINDTYVLSTGLLDVNAPTAHYVDKGFGSNLKEGYGSSAKLTYKNAFQTIVLGADYDDKKLTSNIIAGGEQGIKKWAVFLNDTLVFNKLAITPGIRYENTDTSGDATSPSLGMTYSLANSTILRLYAAKGFNIPGLAARFGDVTGFYVANPDLKAETVWSYQAGVETAALKYIWLKMSAFRNEIRDALTTQPTTTAGFPSTYVNKGRQRRQGFEVEVKTVPVYHFSVSAGAEIIDAKDLDTGERLPEIPTRVYDLGLHYNDEQTFKALLQGRYIDWNVHAPIPELQGDYGSFVFDLSMIKKIHERKNTSLEAFANVHNIFDGKQYPLAVYKNPERWYEGGLRYKF
jgi:vitamin B12 transporter